MIWTFILVALTSGGTVAERVLFDTASHCVAYGQGYLSQPAMRGADVQIAQCVSLHSGEVVPIRNLETMKGKHE